MNIATIKSSAHATVGMFAFFGTTVAAVGLVAKLITVFAHTELAATWTISYIVTVLSVIVWLNFSEKATDNFLEIFGWFTDSE